MAHLDVLSPYPYYFHFTITPYGTDIEPKIPPMGESIDCFKKLADTIGNDHIIWRYDPVFINKRHPVEYHKESFNYIARNLKGYTKRSIFSFLDMYPHLAKPEEALEVSSLDDPTRSMLACNFAQQAQENGMQLQTCAEPYDYSQFGITASSCIDGDLIEHLSGYAIVQRRDRNQRKECGCAASVDIGMYNTCPNLCKYCYANQFAQKVYANYAQARSNSPLLIGSLGKHDKVSTAKEVTQAAQLSLFGEF